MVQLAAFPMHYFPATRCNPILPLNSKRSRLPNPGVRDSVATLVRATGSKVRIALHPPSQKIRKVLCPYCSMGVGWKTPKQVANLGPG
jgi:hypothetical protein